MVQINIFLFIFLCIIFLVNSQINYKYEQLNNSIEVKLIDSKNHLLFANISSYNIGEIIHIFMKMPTGGEYGGYNKDNIKYFILTEEYSNITNITIPDNVKNINVKFEKEYFYYTNFYIDYEIKDKDIKHLIILINDKIEDIYGYAMITDIDESKRVELNINDNMIYNFENIPFLIIFNMGDYKSAFFKLNSRLNILENYEIKYTHFLKSIDLFTTFQDKTFIKIKKEDCYSIKNGDNNYTLYFNFIDINCCTSYAFIINPNNKKEKLSIESSHFSYIQSKYINNFKEEQMVNSVTNNLGLGIISAKPLTNDYLFFVIYQKYSIQRLSDDINFYYSLSNNSYEVEEKDLNLYLLDYKSKQLENNNNIYYCQIYLNNYTSSRLLLYFLGGGGLFIRMGQLYEYIIPINKYSKYTNLFKEKKHYSIGIGDLVENEIYYFKIIIHSIEEVNINIFLSNQTINNLTEVKDPINIKFNYDYFLINNKQIYYFNYNNNNNNISLLIFDILPKKDTSITIENTEIDENINLEKYGNKTILCKEQKLLIRLNITNFEKGENIYLIFEGLLSAFQSTIIYYSMDLISDEYEISQNCKNLIKDTKISIYCNYTKSENNFIKFELLVNPNNFIFIKNSKNYEYLEENNTKDDNSKSSNKILFIIFDTIINLILFIFLICFVKKKKKKNSNKLVVRKMKKPKEETSIELERLL